MGHDEATILLRVHEEVFSQYRGALGVLQDVELTLLIGIAIGHILAYLPPLELSLRLLIEDGAILIALCLTYACPCLPTCSHARVCVYANKEARLGTLIAYLVHSTATLRKRYIMHLRNEHLELDARTLALVRYECRYIAVKLILKELRPIAPYRRCSRKNNDSTAYRRNRRWL